MKRFLTIALCLVGVVNALPPSWEDVDGSYSFEAFMADFSKRYESDEEKELRQTIFERNLQQIMEHNSHRNGRHVLGVNRFMDLEAHELPFGYDKSSKHRKSSTLATQRKLGESHLMKLPFEIENVSTLPKEVDWRTKSVVSPVKDQGGCGSCWAFAAIASLESHIALQTGLLFTLSTQELVSCVPNPRDCGGTGGCAGSTSQIGYDFISTQGIVEEWQFGYSSYKGQDVQCSIMDDEEVGFLRSRPSKRGISQSVATIDGFAETPINDYAAVMNAVAKHGPIVVSVAASNWHLYAGGVFTEPDKKAAAYDINHAVVLVGYGTDEETGEDYWLIRNSWSPRWGEQGYIRLKRQDPSTLENPDDDCGMDVTPADGDACTHDKNGKSVVPKPIKVCGTSGVHYSAVLPVGGHLV